MLSLSLSLSNESVSKSISYKISFPCPRNPGIFARISLQCHERKQLLYKCWMITCASLPSSFSSVFYISMLYRLLSYLFTRKSAQPPCDKFKTQLEELKVCDKFYLLFRLYIKKTGCVVAVKDNI
jgi:hypothetical protein